MKMAMTNYINTNNKENSRYVVLSKKYPIYQEYAQFRSDSVILIHLHYEYFWETAISYLERIPSFIDVLVTTSNPKLENRINSYVAEHSNFKFIKKINRGRDISSLLVSCREEILKYKYVCFIHDKKEKNSYLSSDVHNWIISQFENILGSSDLIKNIIALFEKNEKLGILLSPPIFTDNFSFQFENLWYKNYQNTIKVLEQIGTPIEVDACVSPMAVGSVFWGKVEALHQLFEYEWKYQDFPEEPLPDDGCISHAIERSFEYIVKYNHYSCKWLYNDEYVMDLLEKQGSALTAAFSLLDEKLGINTLRRLLSYSENVQKLNDTYERVYIYGAGICGKRCIKYLRNVPVHVDGFIQTNVLIDYVEGVPVFSLRNLNITEKDLVVIATSTQYWDEIYNCLEKHGVYDNNILFF